MNPYLYGDERRRLRGGGGGGRARIELPKSSGKLPKYGARSSRRRYFRDYYSASGDRVKSIVKSWYVPQNQDAGRHIRQHLKYIKDRERNQEREPEERKIYDRDGNELTLKDAYKRVTENQGDRVAAFNIVLSPGDNSVDLKEYTLNTMNRFADRVDRDLEYFFVVHKNTDHYHSHVVLAGKGPDRGVRGYFERREDANNFAIKVGDLDFLREVSDDYVARHRGLDRDVDRNAAVDLGRANSIDDIRSLYSREQYDATIQKELKISFSESERQTLYELGLERNPLDAYKKRHADIELEKVPPRPVLSDETANAAVFPEYAFDGKERGSWSDADFIRVFQLGDREIHVDWHDRVETDEETRKELVEFRTEKLAQPEFEHFLAVGWRLNALKNLDSYAGQSLKEKGAFEYRQQVDPVMARRAVAELMDTPQGRLLKEHFSELLFESGRLNLRDGGISADSMQEVNGRLSELLENRLASVENKWRTGWPGDLQGDVNGYYLEDVDARINAVAGRVMEARDLASYLAGPRGRKYSESLGRWVELNDRPTHPMADPIERPEYASWSQRETESIHLALAAKHPCFADEMESVERLKELQPLKRVAARIEGQHSKERIDFEEREIHQELDRKVLEKASQRTDGTGREGLDTIEKLAELTGYAERYGNSYRAQKLSDIMHEKVCEFVDSAMGHSREFEIESINKADVSNERDPDYAPRSVAELAGIEFSRDWYVEDFERGQEIDRSGPSRGQRFSETEQYEFGYIQSDDFLAKRLDQPRGRNDDESANS